MTKKLHLCHYTVEGSEEPVKVFLKGSGQGCDPHAKNTPQGSQHPGYDQASWFVFHVDSELELQFEHIVRLLMFHKSAAPPVSLYAYRGPKLLNALALKTYQHWQTNY